VRIVHEALSVIVARIRTKEDTNRTLSERVARDHNGLRVHVRLRQMVRRGAEERVRGV
jgi:hypothetical protein